MDGATQPKSTNASLSDELMTVSMPAAGVGRVGIIRRRRQVLHATNEWSFHVVKGHVVQRRPSRHPHVSYLARSAVYSAAVTYLFIFSAWFDLWTSSRGIYRPIFTKFLGFGRRMGGHGYDGLTIHSFWVPYGRCYGKQFCGKICKNWPTAALFLSLAFQNGFMYSQFRFQRIKWLWFLYIFRMLVRFGPVTS